MPLVENGSYMVCMDCYVVILTGDESFIDMHYTNEKEADKRISEIRNGMSRLANEGNLHDGKNRDEFSRYSCDCCGSALHGERREIKTFGFAID